MSAPLCLAGSVGQADESGRGGFLLRAVHAAYARQVAFDDVAFH
jgi:hypothetical protein